jgi:hypothetical protein
MGKMITLFFSSALLGLGKKNMDKKDERSIRFEIAEVVAQQLKEKLTARGYRTFSEWIREKIREFLRE